MAPNILVVEDCVLTRLLIIRILQQSNMEIGEIYQAENGFRGLDMMENNRIDLLLTDINMPEMDGIEMLWHIRSRNEYKTIPVLIISAENKQDNIELSNDLDAVFINKPFTAEILRGALNQVTQAEYAA